MKTLSGRSFALGFAGVLFLALGAAGCKKTIKNASLEAAIKTAVEKQGLKLKSVSCPAGREAKAGDAFECASELEEGGKASFSVKQKDDKGNVDFSLLGVIVKQTEVTEFLTKQLAGKTDAKCPKGVQVLRKSETCTCTFEGAARGKVDLAATDDEKDFKITISREGAAAPEPAVTAGHKEEAPAAVTAEEE